MRRLAVVFSLLLALLAATGAGAAKPSAHLVVTKGSAQVDGAQLKGWLVVANRGAGRSTAGKVRVVVVGGEAPSGVRRLIAQRAPVRPLAAGAKQTVRVAATIAGGLDSGSWEFLGCARRCRKIGGIQVGAQRSEATPAAPEGRSNAPSTNPSAPTAPIAPPSTPPSTPVSTVPTDPVPYVAGQPFEVEDGATDYWAFVPETYDPGNETAMPLLIWLHGCGGYSEGDIWVVDPGEEAQPPQDWLTIAVGGREGSCWVPSVDEAKVMAALADFETHFNVDRRRVILGGYSSGGDLAYRTGFRHSATFAGLLIENSSPFRDTESTEAESLAAATTKLHIVHLAHLQDTTYPIAGVRSETEAVKAAGFPIELIEVPGEHWNDEGDVVAGHPVPGTDADLRELLLPHIDDGWMAPGG